MDLLAPVSPVSTFSPGANQRRSLDQNDARTASAASMGQPP
jgi:hypothetical protein